VLFCVTGLNRLFLGLALNAAVKLTVALGFFCQCAGSAALLSSDLSLVPLGVWRPCAFLFELLGFFSSTTPALSKLFL